MSALPDDERAILAVYAEAAEPLDRGDVVESLLPRRPRGPRRGGKRAWVARFEEMARATAALYKAGLLAGRSEGLAYMTVITEAGREALWGPKPSGWITTDAVLTREKLRRGAKDGRAPPRRPEGRCRSPEGLPPRPGRAEASYGPGTAWLVDPGPLRCNAAQVPAPDPNRTDHGPRTVAAAEQR